MKYKQPNFYHFNSDSIKLINFVKKKAQLRELITVCDIGAGCGVIGIELANAFNMKSLDLVEVQDVFLGSLIENIERFNLRQIAKAKILDFKELNSSYELIVSNPPYFFSDKSRPSTNAYKKICRCFSKGDEISFLEALERNLSQKGEGFLVIPANCSYWNFAISNSSLEIIDKEVDGGIQLVLLKHRDGC